MMRDHLLFFCLLGFALVSCGSAGSQQITIKKTDVDTPDKNIFYSNLPAGFQQPQNDAERLLLREYGAVFVARNGVTPPSKIVFKDEADVTAYQSGLTTAKENIGGIMVRLQQPGMTALLEARKEAQKAGVSINPRSADSSARNYEHTVDLWASRVNPGLIYWTGKGKITQADANRIKKLSPFDQVPEIFALEANGSYFAKSLDKSIIYSVAPPGASQHLSMLALDVREFDNAKVRAVLAKHGWFQTVTSDLPHFTYLGVSENELPGLGLKRVENSGRVFWVPDI
jgi:hypothetical protein